MDDLASAPAQRTGDDGRRASEQNLAPRKRVVKKVQAAPAPKPVPEPVLSPEPETEHRLDVLA